MKDLKQFKIKEENKLDERIKELMLDNLYHIYSKPSSYRDTLNNWHYKGSNYYYTLFRQQNSNGCYVGLAKHSDKPRPCGKFSYSMLAMIKVYEQEKVIRIIAGDRVNNLSSDEYCDVVYGLLNYRSNGPRKFITK